MASLKAKSSKKEKGKRKPDEEVAEPLPEEELLAEALFGKAEDKYNQAWSIDTAPSTSGGRKRPLAKADASNKKAAWVDDDEIEPISLTATNRTRKLRASAAPEDNTVSGEDFEEKLRARFLASQASQQQEWAKLPSNKSKARRRENVDSDDENSNDEGGSGSDEDDYESAAAAVLRSTAPLKRGGGEGPLPAGELDVLRCKDANAAGPSRAVVRSCSFHPAGELLLTAGLDKTLRFFSVDGTRNPLLETCFLKDMPAYQAQWTNGGEQVVVSGRRPFFYVYDAHSGVATKVPGLGPRGGVLEKSLEKLSVSPDGQTTAFTLHNGWIGLLDNRSNRLASEFKMNGTARSLCFSPDSRHLVGSGGDAEVYMWDLRAGHTTSSIVRKFANEGGLPTCALATDGTNLACASEAGVVNLYSLGLGGFPGPPTSTSPPKPWKALLNLTTPVETLTFSHDGSMLAMASRWTKNAARVVHVKSGTVFSNWPTSKSPLNYVFSMDFSPKSGYLAMGNDKGRVLLYRLNHYSDV